MITQRTFGPECSAMTLIDVSGMKDGDYAGLTTLQRKYGFVGAKMQDGKKFIVMIEAENGLPAEKASVPLEGNCVSLKIECDFRDRKDEAQFFWGNNGEQWSEIGK